jgi:beta-galactosidase
MLSDQVKADPDASRQVTIGPRSLLLGHEELPFLSGAMHYFRVPRRHWERCLDALVELGLVMVESYVPWSVHERSDGRFDFGDGPAADGLERDLSGFLSACAERGLRVMLRPGPCVNAELTFFGFPRRILADQRCLALGSRGNPVIMPTPPRYFPVPSYASKQLLAEAGRWLRAFGDFVAPHCWPDGPVVAAQVDNELSLFFRTGAYDQDYHEDAIELYRR